MSFLRKKDKIGFLTTIQLWSSFWRAPVPANSDYACWYQELKFVFWKFEPTKTDRDTGEARSLTIPANWPKWLNKSLKLQEQHPIYPTPALQEKKKKTNVQGKVMKSLRKTYVE